MGGMIDFGHALRLAQRVAPRIAAFLPRSVCLLPLLRAAALFALRGDAAREEAASAQGCNNNVTSPTAEHTSENTAADDLRENYTRGKAPSCQAAVHRMRIELAVCRSRREAGSLSFDQLGSYEKLAHVASNLCRVVWKARPQNESSLEDFAHEQEEEPNPKRRRFNSTGSAGRASSQTLAATAHNRRWEASEAEEEEMRLLEGGRKLESNGALRDFVRENRKVYSHVDGSPREWRWLPVDVLWAAAPLTKGFISDPFHFLNRRLQAQKTMQQCDPYEEAGTDGDSGVLPFLDRLLHSTFPCACRHIDSWRWRAVGVTVFFGPFDDQHGPAQELTVAPSHGLDGTAAATCNRSCICASELHEPQHGHEAFEAGKEGKRLRRNIKRLFTAFLHDVLQFTGIRDPDLCPAASERLQESAEGKQDSGASGPPSSPQAGRPMVEANSDDPDSATATTTECSSDTQLGAQGPLQRAASNIACFARQTFTPCSSPSERLCNCFYSQSISGSCQRQVQSAERKSATSDPDPGNGDCCSGLHEGRNRYNWKDFVRRLVAAATKKVLKIRRACASGRCWSGDGSGAEPYCGSKTECGWRAFIWSECRKLVHSYLAAASSHSTFLRLALPPPISKKGKKRQHMSGVPLSAEPLPQMARQDFLRRVMNAYLSSQRGNKAPQTTAEAKSTGSPPAEEDVTNYSTDRNIGYQSPEGGDTQDRGGNDAAGLWTPEELLHWQLGCSMWCNSALRVLSAHHLAPLLQLHSCTGS